MKVIQLPHRDTKRFSKIILDYLEGSELLKPFYKYNFSIESIEQVIDDKSKENIDRNLLVTALKVQNKEYLSLYPQIAGNIQSLLSEKTFTITTGHQLCLFGGPIYFITKVISAIKTCKLLTEQYPTYNFVPVFWLAAEDHGRGEVSSINLFGNKLSWEDETSTPTGNISSKEILEVLGELKTILGESENAKQLISIFEEAYDGKRNLVAATRHYLTKFFGDEGLVLIDGDDITLKQQLVSIIKEELTTNVGRFEVNKATSDLEMLSYAGQVYPRDLNFFKFTEDKQRVGIDEVDEADIVNHPEKYSPNVIYRPLYQELVLPNLAYIGGPGETAYWFQLKGVFNHFNVNFPMLIVRDNSMVISSAVTKKMNKLNISINSLFESKQETEKRLLQELSSIDLTLEKENAELALIFDDLKAKVEQVDKSLLQSIEGEKTKQLKSFEGLAKRLHKAEKRKQEETLKHLDGIHNKLFPNDKLQERHDNFMSLYVLMGKELFKHYEKAFNPFEKRFTILLDD